MKLSEFDFILPKDLIAKYPEYPRGNSRLLHLNHDLEVEDHKFEQITQLFKEGDLLVLNDTKVIPAYLEGKITNSEGLQKDIVVYLNHNLGEDSWFAFTKPAKLAEIGRTIEFRDGLCATITSKDAENQEVVLQFNINSSQLFSKICEVGEMPIPPYFKRKPQESDKTDYQTVFAKDYGSVAAPTAGLHFNCEMLQKIKSKKVDIAHVTLHVGTGTFLPIKTEDVDKHKMHSERFSISKEVADTINQKKKEGRRIICVGTTSLRTLEAATDQDGIIHSQSGATNIFIKPGYKFKIVDCLITNFHTPKSTLFMLVCAFSGTATMKDAYAHAIQRRYRFFSYGDACWLNKAKQGCNANSEIDIPES
jgi:S-adenosylmethionine:tRNA ribosyltransferase-isomerase